jgi:REP element-mobilizing transposase RayT
MTPSAIDVYRRQIEKELQAGNATEHTHRPALKTLIESLASGVTATNEPKRVECGAPDFAVTEKRVHGPITIGHIESKDVGKDLGEVEKSDQMKRYLPALPNLILTDYLEFRWYVNGEHRQSVRLARVGKPGKLVPEKDGAEAVTDLLSAFLSQLAEPINDPKALALRMARLTHFIRDMIVTAFEAKAASVTLRDLHGAFEKALIPDLPIPQFADMFAQTLAYGLFAARVNHHGPTGSFKRLGAASEIPKTNPFLRQLFETITGTALDEEPFVGFVDDLAQLLGDTDMEAVLADFGRRTVRQDPVMHFYETFLAAYDPKLREARGVYYTPEPVVSYIVRSVDCLLKTRFGCANGLADKATVEYEREEDSAAAVYDRRASSEKTGADRVPLQRATSPRVVILDPACGTGTFLYTVIDHIRSEFMRQGNAGMWSGYVRNHLLPRIFGFELLMAPYAMAHLKLGMQLAGHDLTPAQREGWAYDFFGDERLGVYLTNTLEEAERRAETLFGPLRVITQEANAASEIKRNMPILVVIGNPPYSGHSANKGQWIKNLVEDYKKNCPELHKPAQAKWLQDDYVKFVRWGQWRIRRTGAGVLAFITNSGYLDNPTFRGMRQRLLSDFGDIYILNLHGSSKKKEASPDASRDENVFDIQQGVAIGVFVREPGTPRPARVHHSELWGQREIKYDWLFETDIQTTQWQDLQPRDPLYLFIPQDTDLLTEYERGWKLSRAMDQNGDLAPGIVTTHDEFAISWDSEEAKEKVRRLLATASEEEARGLFQLCTQSQWNYERAKEQLQDGAWKKRVVPILYRPFDVRWTVYDSNVAVHRRERVMRHMLADANLGLLTTRQTRDKWDVLATGRICAHKSLSAYDITSIVPLYLFPTGSGEKAEQAALKVEASHWPKGKDGRRPNLNAEFVADLEKRLGLSFVSDGKGDLKRTFGPEDTFNYIYAVLHSPTYRTRYAEFLKSDFPRVPLTSDVKVFRSLCGLGAELVALHLLDSSKLSEPIARYPVTGPNLVEKGFPKYLAPGEREPGKSEPLTAGRVYINRGTGVPPVFSHGQDAHATLDHGQDAHATLRIRHGAYLPHWTRECATYAVCFRLGDSLPASAIAVWKFEREDIIKTARQLNRPLTLHEEERLDKLFSDKVERYLDEGRGECWMRRDEVAAVVASALQYFEGKRYHLVAWCVMPNHVHAIVQPLAGIDLDGILHSWKSFSSKEANRLIGRSGQFWQPESYDHLIRDENDFARQVEYVLANPLRAGLRNWKWVGGGTGVPPVFSHGQDPHATGQYFEGVPPEAWNFHIGGYQVCEKWLKDRRGRTLTYDDLEHYCKVVTALSETIHLMAEIDAAIPKWPIE